MLGSEAHTFFSEVFPLGTQEGQFFSSASKKRSDYYAFGLVMPGRSSNSANPNDDMKFTGYEKDDEAGLKLYHAGNRMYDPVLGRFMQIDRFYDKYPNMSTYQYAANNPVNFIDVNGDSINVARIQQYDKDNGTNYLNTIISDLQAVTGLQYSVTENGQLVYATDKDGNAIVSTDKDGNKVGSAEARTRMVDAISTTDQAFATISSHRSSVPASGSPLIRLNPGQIDTFINGTSANLDSRTMGYGMTFMHEMLHSNVGISQPDGTSMSQKRTIGHTGPVVDIMNTIRSQVGSSFGQRLSYPAAPINGSLYIPFDRSSLRSVKRGIVPSSRSMFIKN